MTSTATSWEETTTCLFAWKTAKVVLAFVLMVAPGLAPAGLVQIKTYFFISSSSSYPPSSSCLFIHGS